MEKQIRLTAAEWNVLECLWDKAPCTGRDAVEALEKNVGWSRSTTLTMLRRMTEKGLVSCEISGNVLCYRPLVSRNLAVREETRSFLDRVYQGSLSLMLSTMTSERDLSREEISQLYEVLRKAEEEAK